MPRQTCPGSHALVDMYMPCWTTYCVGEWSFAWSNLLALDSTMWHPTALSANSPIFSLSLCIWTFDFNCRKVSCSVCTCNALIGNAWSCRLSDCLSLPLCRDRTFKFGVCIMSSTGLALVIPLCLLDVTFSYDMHDSSRRSSFEIYCVSKLHFDNII